jgi:hypothetical protein
MLFKLMDDAYFSGLLPKTWGSVNSKAKVMTFLRDFLKQEGVKTRLCAEGELGAERYTSLLQRTEMWARNYNRMHHDPSDVPAAVEPAAPPPAPAQLAAGSSTGASALAAAPPAPTPAPPAQDEAGDGPEIEATQITEEEVDWEMEEEEEEEEEVYDRAASQLELKQLTSTLQHAVGFFPLIRRIPWAKQMELECRQGLAILESMQANRK